MLDFSTTAQTRKSIREYLPEPLSQAELDAVLKDALRAPSAVNAQPWLVHIVSGEELKRLSDKLVEGFRTGNLAPDFVYDQHAFTGVYEDRMRDSYQRLYDAYGILREDKAGRKSFAEENARFYGAPHAAFFFMPDITDNVFTALDVGMLAQNFMLSLTARGFGSVPQIALIYSPDVVRQELNVPDNYKLVLGMSFGRPKPDSTAKSYIQPRAPQSETVVFHS
ncbi:nitroreductase [Neisseria sp. N95_16]|uniref:Nitroreductase n=1 Tax=Neisseria brasiliensis TaxID=2666100 RepID=A0A5Q3RUL4_9NEIS|nr:MULTISPECIES: nitroreductase family protein [Neisseria]MRN37164.1 nitroreductase [Neisseria brasiliensis]PJO10114.1 nitroreductase [Neisseria sp. N95_16]PJO78780.1 nitroreductase [Neisseria sp. N177_16]QGL24172.1 nitroreductase [Neisseria brasiliensis]